MSSETCDPVRNWRALSLNPSLLKPRVSGSPQNGLRLSGAESHLFPCDLRGSQHHCDCLPQVTYIMATIHILSFQILPPFIRTLSDSEMRWESRTGGCFSVFLCTLDL